MSGRKFLGWRPYWGEEKGDLTQNQSRALRQLEEGVTDRNLEYTDSVHCRLKRVYLVKARTAEEERADVVAWLRGQESTVLSNVANGIKLGVHVGAAKKGDAT